MRQAIQLRSLMNKSAKSIKAILEQARELKGQSLKTTDIMKSLIAVGKEALQSRSNKPTEKTYAVLGDKKGVVVKQTSGGAITIKVSKLASGDKEAVIKAVTQFLS